jgi:hypothetical protein
MRIALPFAAILAGAACNTFAGPEDSAPIPECTQYEATFQMCFHRKMSIFDASPPKTREERAQMADVCADNLRRLNAACR